MRTVIWIATSYRMKTVLLLFFAFCFSLVVDARLSLPAPSSRRAVLSSTAKQLFPTFLLADSFVPHFLYFSYTEVNCFIPPILPSTNTHLLYPATLESAVYPRHYFSLK